MKAYRELYFCFKLDDGLALNVFRHFASHSREWDFLEKESEEYTQAVGEPSCAILYLGSARTPLLAVSKRNINSFYVTNVVPKESGRLPVADYNEILKTFARSFRHYLKKNKVPATIRLTKEVKSLKDIIGGKKTRSYFESYLALYPTSYHFNDINRLDIFICAISRYTKGDIDLDNLWGYLRAAKGWVEGDCDWCINRIRTGLEILAANRRF